MRKLLLFETLAVSDSYANALNKTDASGVVAVSDRPDAVDSPTFNLMGQRVSSAKRGIIVKNGKKFFVK